MKELTAQQEKILNFIQERQVRTGLAPTYREISKHFRFRSANAALAHVKALLTKGALRQMPGLARSLQVVNPLAPKSRGPSPRIVSIPIFGTIPAGQPIDGTQENEGCVLIDVETIGVRPSTRTFGLKVRGDSMVGKCIMDGDVAIIEHGVEPRSGDVVAALIDGQVTLKTFLTQRGKPYLRAENPRYPNLIPQEELQVQGVMVALVRKTK